MVLATLDRKLSLNFSARKASFINARLTANTDSAYICLASPGDGSFSVLTTLLRLLPDAEAESLQGEQFIVCWKPADRQPRC